MFQLHRDLLPDRDHGGREQALDPQPPPLRSGESKVFILSGVAQDLLTPRPTDVETGSWIHGDNPSLFTRDGSSGLFLGGMTGLVGQHSLFGAAAAAAFLAADFFDTGAFGGNAARARAFDFIQQQAPGDKAVKSLLARGLAFDL
jgi:hypothetical protein